MDDSARVRLTDQHSSRQKKRRRSDADASDAGGQRTSTGCTASSSHRLSRHTCTAAHALVLLLSANLMLCTDAFSNENVLSRNNFGRATLDVPTFDHHGPATGAFSSNTKRYSRSGAKVILSASRERTDTTSSSGSGGSFSSSSSRFGVRKRVKSVIQKAKSRKIAKAARAEAAEAEAEIQHIIEQDDMMFEEENNKESEVAVEVLSETGSSSGPQAVDSDVTVEEVEEVNGSVVAQAKKETDIDNDTDNASSPSLSGEKITQTSEQAAYNEAKSATLESKDIEEAPEDKDGGDNDAAAEDVIVADVEPLPFELPNLTDEQQRQLDMGERVQFQNDMGREGSGFVVLDVKAPPDVVWECLLDFQSYPETIPTVREVTMYTNTHLSGDYRSEKPVAFEDGTMATLAHGVPSVTRAAFTLSKFRLKIAAIHRYTPHPVGDYMVFTLDPACTNLVLKDAKGIWHTQSNPDNKGEVRLI